MAPRRTLPAVTPDGGLRRHLDGAVRCWWCGTDPEYVAYHDREWGRPVHDERALFEKICLEAFQAGLSWLTVLARRDALRAAFADFDPAVVAGFGPDEAGALLEDPRIIRHRGKIEAVITNARAVLALRDAGRSLTELVWSHAPADHRRPRRIDDIPTRTAESTALAAELRGAGFVFVGPTTMYALLQAMGIVDDHLDGCHVAA